MQFLDLIVNKCHKGVNLFIKHILQDFPVKRNQYTSATSRDWIGPYEVIRIWELTIFA